jgi:hypothetical protein
MHHPIDHLFKRFCSRDDTIFFERAQDASAPARKLLSRLAGFSRAQAKAFQLFGVVCVAEYAVSRP